MAKKFTASTSSVGGLKPDPRFGSKLVSKFINCLMGGGKKRTAQRVFYDAMDIIHRSSLVAGDSSDASRAPKDELELFETAVNNLKPLIEVRSKRIGGASYQVPMQVNAKRQQTLAFRWLLQSTRAKKGRPIAERLAAELLNAYKQEGDAMKIRENIHKMAEANKAFAHFAW